MDTTNDKFAAWKLAIEQMVEGARADGVIITVTLSPKLPLAMGNYDQVVQVVDVRERRVMAEPIVRDVRPA